jgi:hypothetical protein
MYIRAAVDNDKKLVVNAYVWCLCTFRINIRILCSVCFPLGRYINFLTCMPLPVRELNTILTQKVASDSVKL